VDVALTGAHNPIAIPDARGAFAKEQQQMDFFRNMQQKDWIIAAVAFVAGAIIF
jgi:hypothetical protein